MFSLNDVSCLAKDLPDIAILNDFPSAPIEKLATAFEQSGANVYVFNLTDKVKLYSYFNSALKNRIVPKDKGKDFYPKFKVIQKLFFKKNPSLNYDYEYLYSGACLHVPLLQEKAFQNCELALLGDFGMLIDADMISTTLKDKQILMRCSGAQAFTGFCGSSGGCTKWQQDGCAECPMLGRNADNKDMCAEFFARKKTGYAELQDVTVVTPSRWLNREIRKSVLGRKCLHTVIPTSVQLDIFRPMPQREARERLGIPQDRPVILAGSAGLRKNKGGDALCKALRQLDGQWSGTPPRVLVFGHDAPFLARLRDCGLEAQCLGWIGDLHTLACVYAAADVFVSPSFQDNLPNTVNESLACGTPVICFDRFSSEDVVIDGVTGFLARHPGLPLSPEGELIQPAPYEPEPERCADLAAKILQFFELPQWRRDMMRHECRQLAEATFNPAQEAAHYLQLFRQMLGLPYISLY